MEDRLEALFEDPWGDRKADPAATSQEQDCVRRRNELLDRAKRVKDAKGFSAFTPESEQVLQEAGNPSAGRADSGAAGCFGQTVLLGRRHHATHRAAEDCEVLMITKEDLEYLLTSDPLSARRICRALILRRAGYAATKLAPT